MSLGDHFPEDYRQNHFDQNFKPGHVFYLYCGFTQPPKEKYLLLACKNPAPLFLIINSNIHPFIANDPNQYRCQVTIDVANHEFLDHDSYIDCREPFDYFSLDVVKRQIIGDVSRIKGPISSDVKSQVIAAIKASSLIAPRHQEWILSELV